MTFRARAPARLDVMGGIADYSGATVLELPLACGTTATVEEQREPRFDLATHRADGLREVSLRAETLDTADALREWLKGHAADRWVGYVAGVIQWCRFEAKRNDLSLPPGLRVEIESDVPEGRGVASSAALEVAVAAATAACYGLIVRPEELAAACQQVENHIVGAPCGIMDQMTSAVGRKDRLLRLRCQPATVEGYIEIPRGLRFFGIDSGISHAVTGADYGAVRTAAYTGYHLLAKRAGAEADGRWAGYLANVSPEELRTSGADLPDEIRAATAHPVHEQRRILEFATLLEAGGRDPVRLGELMYQSHDSYSACGLGSAGTDRLVELVRSFGPSRGLFGAKITGGGSGGTVAILGAKGAEPLVREIAARYGAETGRDGTVFSASGPALDVASARPPRRPAP